MKNADLPVKRACFFAVLGILFLSTVTVPLKAEEEPQDESLILTSETDLNSADVKLNGTDPDEDKKRTTIGQGETVTLTLTGKGISGETKVKWTKSGSGATFSAGESTSATLKAFVTETGTYKVSAEVDGKKSNELTFTIVAPASLSGKKISEAPTGAGTIGVSGAIQVTVQPTNVSFSNLQIVELDGGTVVDPASGPFGFPVHQPNPTAARIDEFNQFTDTVAGSEKITKEIKEMTTFVKWHWVCHFRTVGQGSHFTTEHQTFAITRNLAPPVNTVTMAINKFGVDFSSTVNVN